MSNAPKKSLCQIGLNNSNACLKTSRDGHDVAGDLHGGATYSALGGRVEDT